MLSLTAQEEGSKVERAGLFSPRLSHFSRFPLWKSSKEGRPEGWERKNEEGLTIRTGKDVPPMCSPCPKTGCAQTLPLSWLVIRLTMPRGCHGHGVATEVWPGKRKAW